MSSGKAVRGYTPRPKKIASAPVHVDALPTDKVIIGYLNSDTTPQIVAESMRLLVTGRSNVPTTYTLLQHGGYPAFSGAMFWTIDADRREEYRYSNVVGPLLHGLPARAR